MQIIKYTLLLGLISSSFALIAKGKPSKNLKLRNSSVSQEHKSYSGCLIDDVRDQARQEAIENELRIALARKDKKRACILEQKLAKILFLQELSQLSGDLVNLFSVVLESECERIMDAAEEGEKDRFAMLNSLHRIVTFSFENLASTGSSKEVQQKKLPREKIKSFFLKGLKVFRDQGSASFAKEFSRQQGEGLNSSAIPLFSAFMNSYETGVKDLVSWLRSVGLNTADIAELFVAFDDDGNNIFEGLSSEAKQQQYIKILIDELGVSTKDARMFLSKNYFSDIKDPQFLKVSLKKFGL